MSIKYRDSATSTEWKEIQNTTVINKLCYMQDIWFNCAVTRNAGSVQQWYEFDVTDAKTFTFNYDYNASESATGKAVFNLVGCYGYKLGAGKYEQTITTQLIPIDSSVKTQLIARDLKEDVSGATVTIDVSNYTSIVLEFTSVFNTTASPSNINWNYGYAHLYNIRASEE